MQIEIHAGNLQTSPALREHASRRAAFVLSRVASRIRRISIHLSDENGPRGGVDKRCRINVHLVGAPTAVVEDAHTDVYALIDRAMTRAGRVVSRRLQRLQLAVRRPSAPKADDATGQLLDRRRRYQVLTARQFTQDE